MQKWIILHSNDIHGRIEGLSRIATLVERTRLENPTTPVVYLDAGDSEEMSQRLSNLTKGNAMYRLLSAAGCAASTLGNGGLSAYSPHILSDYARSARFPLLLANLRNQDGSLLEGVQASTLLTTGESKLGIIGVTVTEFYGQQLYGENLSLARQQIAPLIQELATELRQQGADVIILLSHMGLPDDIWLSLDLKDRNILIIGGHTHNLAPSGVWSGKMLLAQAGEFAQHLGRLDLAWDGEQLQVERVSMLPVTEDIPPSPHIQKELIAIEAEVEQMLSDIVGQLTEPLELAVDRECSAANFAADALRDRMDAEVGVIVAGIAFGETLQAGPLTRLALWNACPSPANPGVTYLTGTQLEQLIRRGQDPKLAANTPRGLRGRSRGLMHVSGACIRDGHIYIGERLLEPDRIYKTAATDWELEIYGGYITFREELQIHYDTQVIMRDLIEDYLKGKPPISVQGGRL